MLFLIIFHFTNGFLFLKQTNNLLCVGTPNYYVIRHLKMIVDTIRPSITDDPLSTKKDILFIFSFLLTKLFGCSLLVLRLSPLVGFILLIIVVYTLTSFIFNNTKTGVLAACLVSFIPANIFYSRVYSHQMFFITAVYLTLYFMITFFLRGGWIYFIFYAAIVYAGSTMLTDASLGLLFLLYISGPLFFIFRYRHQNDSSSRRYGFLALFFGLGCIKVIMQGKVNSYYMEEGIQKFIYPGHIKGWIYFLNFYFLEIINSVYIIPFILFVGLYIYLLWLPQKYKIVYGFNRIHFISSLFFAFFLLSLCSKKQIYYITPILPLVGIVSAAGIMLIHKKAIKISVIFFLMLVNVIYFFSFFGRFYDVSGFSGEKVLKEYNAQIEPYANNLYTVGGFYSLNPYYAEENNYYITKKQTYLTFRSDQEQGKKRTIEEIKNSPLFASTANLPEELAFLEYIMDNSAT